jgi:hypothetical protein
MKNKKRLIKRKSKVINVCVKIKFILNLQRMMEDYRTMKGGMLQFFKYFYFDIYIFV